jgi:hypothetical protein
VVGIRIQDPGSGAFLTPGSWMGKKIKIRIRDENPESYFRRHRNNFLLKIVKFFDADPEIFLPWIRDGKKSGIREKPPRIHS